ncbi:hypothetical protein DL98DRAFT_571923 [Cadophora sp. DSE1049]|nr:hypothetical protein DL98DRAFT_571923 [Cadophora sp. DSE1049]
MPSKIQLDENLWFLYICLQKSDLKAIDFNAVGLATGLKSPAARMRYTRLRRQIESGSLNTGHGPGFSSTSPPSPSSPSQQRASVSTPASVPKKRKRRKKSEDTVALANVKVGGEDGDKNKGSIGNAVKDGNTAADGISKKEVDRISKESKKEEKKASKIKLEDHSGSDADADFDSESEDDEDSEDEIPLAKLRKRKATGLPPPPALSKTSVAGHVQHPVPTITAPAYSTYATSRSYGYGSPSSGIGEGHGNLMERPRYVPRGFNALTIGSGNGRGGFDGSGVGGGSTRGVDGRALYASPYAGWIDGRGHEDQMGNPGPGWEYRVRLQEQQYQKQRQEHERGRDIGNEAPRRSV